MVIWRLPYLRHDNDHKHTKNIKRNRREGTTHFCLACLAHGSLEEPRLVLLFPCAHSVLCHQLLCHQCDQSFDSQDAVEQEGIDSQVFSLNAYTCMGFLYGLSLSIFLYGFSMVFQSWGVWTQLYHTNKWGSSLTTFKQPSQISPNRVTFQALQKLYYA